MDQDSRTRPYALVTGASSGIGRELAVVLAREGHALVLVARRTEPLRALAEQLERAHGTPCVVVGADLGIPEGVAEVTREVEARGLAIEVLVNNAGFGLAGPVATLPAESQLGMIDLNIRALTALTRAFLPGMVARGRGYVLNVASTAAFLPGPLMAVYFASKAYVLSLSNALHEELRGQGVRVTALCPGYTETEFATRASEHQRPRLFGGPLGTGSARQVAEIGYRGMKRGRAVVIPGLLNKLSAWFVRFTPLALKLRMTRYLNGSGK
ncbi:Short-chain dehydrogenase [Cystobacter fuscus DSM 2262]|uniref:Short-chain dehydrogenase n=1 Tax=Cystobacter fuscus (strain ATCC 25194 / DSM 2262 / NBRC 100088 / M29) TaxID=1242864 RepID=S9P1Q4_CYSF2|nr:SDR family oxidoreductase [Cystobacter fuscus]EPX58405.1 Short-chain dehydrogenase [Cystobacter fuscus DSM 2262]